MKTGITLRRAARAITLALIPVLLLMAGSVYWLGSRHGLAWIARQAVAASEGRLQLEGVDGSVFGRITLARAAFTDATTGIEARQVVLDWQPQRLFWREAYISTLTVASLRIKSADTDPAKPPQPPATLRLPLDATVADARVQHIEIANAGSVHGLHFRGRARAQAHELELIRVSALGTHAAGTLRLATAAPFAASGKLTVEGKLLDESVKAGVAVGGSLDALQLQASASTRGAAAEATALLHPFSGLPLAKLTLDGSNVDLAAFDKTLPHTGMAFALAAGMPSRGRFAGTLRVSNAAPGPIDTQRLPLTRAALSFAGGGTRWAFSDIDLDIGKSGRAQGSGAIDGAGARLQLELARVGTAELHRRLKPLRVSGRTTLTGDRDAQHIDARLAGGGVTLEFAARHARQILTVERGTLRAENARLEFTGHAALAAKRAFSVDAAFSNLDPARFLEAPAARLNGKVSAQGVLLPAWQAQLHLTLANSRLRGQPLSATAAFVTREQQWFAGEASALYGGNRLNVSGHFGRPGDQLQWSVDAPDLKIIDATLAGNLKAQGTFAGSIERPSAAFALSARKLVAGDLAANALDAQGTVNGGADGALRLNARVAGARTGTTMLGEINVDAQGSRLRHDIRAALRGANLDASLQAAGGLDGHWRWNGSVTALDARGRFPLRLTAPARLSAGPHLLHIDGLQASALGGRLGPAQLHLERGTITTRGTMTGIAAKSLLALAPQSAIDPRDAMLGGRWDITLKEAASGTAEFQLEKGDLGVQAEPKIQLGLRQLKLSLTAADNRIEAAFGAHSTSMGTLTAAVRTRIERHGTAWVLTQNAPLDGTVALDMQSLAWLRALTPQLDRVGGRASTRLTLAGTLGRPLLSGETTADAVEVRAIGPGVHLRNGTLRAALDGRQLKIAMLSVNAGDGRIEADGVADLDGGLRSLAVTARATRARILSSPQLTVVLSGSGSAGLRDRRLALDGKFKIDEGRYDLGSGRKPELGDDVIVVGRTPAPGPGAKPLRVLLDVTVDLNDRFSIRGHGLDAVLGGSLRTMTRGDALQASGTIQTVRGKYFAFGQELEIERGRLYFSGPLNNPGLDLRAGRKIKAVAVGVEVGGSLQRPAVKLVSDPSMPDTDKLGWLVLGRDPRTASPAELAVLQAATLATGGRHAKPLQSRIADRLGLDQFGLSRGDGDAMGVLALGKRISDRLTVRLEQTLGGSAGGLLKIDYLLSQRWRLEGTAGAENAADILFTLRFD